MSDKINAQQYDMGPVADGCVSTLSVVAILIAVAMPVLLLGGIGAPVSLLIAAGAWAKVSR